MAETIAMHLDPLNIIGTFIDDYAIVDYLTTGGTGHIYRAQLRNQDVVIKLLRSELSTEPDAKRRFHKEAFVLKQLKHPHIIDMLDEGRHKHMPYMVFEYAPLGSLHEYTESDHSDFTLGDVAIIIQQITSALRTLHEKKFIHRDIKPSNIMMRDHHNAVLADFGIVRTEDVNVRFDVQPGTLDFMAPEQLVGLEADFTSDQFALGVMTYWLLTGEKPFTADTREEASVQRRIGPLSVHDLNHRLPKDFDAVLRRAMQFDMRERFSSIEEFSHLITQIIETYHLEDFPALGSFTLPANITRNTNTIPYRPIKKKHSRLRTWMEPYGWISLSLVGLMLIIITLASTSPFGIRTVAQQPRPSEQVIADLLTITDTQATFACDAFRDLFGELQNQVNMSNSDYLALSNLTSNTSATYQIAQNFCTNTTNTLSNMNPDTWDAMRQELQTASTN